MLHNKNVDMNENKCIDLGNVPTYNAPRQQDVKRTYALATKA